MFGFSPVDLVRSVTRESFYDFVRQFWGTIIAEEPVWNWHIEVICDELQQVMERVFARKPKEHDLIINVCPGSTKSTLCSVMLLPWTWTRMSEFQSINCSYTATLAENLGLRARDVILSEKYQATFGVSLREDKRGVKQFLNTKRGSRYAVGVKGSLIGMHGHGIVVDDPIDPQTPLSKAETLSVNDWLTQTLPGRVVDKRTAPVIMLMQRLGVNDPTAERLKLAADLPVRHVCIPAELSDKVQPPELADFYVDGLMDPIRLSSKVLSAQKKIWGLRGYAGQFGQDPMPLGGGMFDTTKLNRGQLPPHLSQFKRLVRYWDKAGTFADGCFTVGLLMGELIIDEQPTYWILDVERFQLDSARRNARMKRVADQDGVKVLIGIEQEPGSGGLESAQNSVRNLSGYRVRLQRPTGDKATRADQFSSQVNAGNVWIKPAVWNKDYIDELTAFPDNTDYMDQVDATSGAFSYLAKQPRIAGAL